MNADLLMTEHGRVAIITDASWEKHGLVDAVILKTINFSLGFRIGGNRFVRLNISVPDHICSALIGSPSIYLGLQEKSRIVRVDKLPLIVINTSGKTDGGKGMNFCEFSLEEFDAILDTAQYHEAVHRENLDDDGFISVFNSNGVEDFKRYSLDLRTELAREKSENVHKPKHPKRRYTREHVMHLKPGKSKKRR